MKTEHTPGPFKAIKGTEGDSDRCSIVSAGPIPYLIATIENGQPGDSVETELATAHLFAASHDLLEALEMANLEFHFPIVGHSSECICARCEFVRKALAAIAKARGKEGF